MQGSDAQSELNYNRFEIDIDKTVSTSISNGDKTPQRLDADEQDQIAHQRRAKKYMTRLSVHNMFMQRDKPVIRSLG
jgi:hypothetical protein